ncbi:hypothetical protein [Egicoccus sp. AB-alg2]|uniref:DUF7144 family membrane protein n=1 Tax=Egicoccus sp. AB-alg2 TaxID=3242693 RepID=UPI00359E66F9
MSQTYGTEARRRAVPEQTSGWAAGWMAFAAIMMIVQGIWWLTAGFIALVDDQFYVVGQEYVFQFDLTTWGWIHLIVGAVVLAAGIGLFSGAMWARVVGVVVASVAALIAFAWIPYYPIWGLLLIGVSVAVIWAITAHGHSLETV